MLDEAVCTQINAVHGALNYRPGRLAVVAGAFAFAALQRGQEIRIGVDLAAESATLQIEAGCHEQGAQSEERQGCA